MDFCENVNLFKNEGSNIKNSFQIQFPYNIKVLRIIKKIQKIYYCKKTKIWYFPIEEYATFKDQLSDHPEFEFEVKESKAVVIIKTIADRIEIKFIDEFKKY